MGLLGCYISASEGRGSKSESLTISTIVGVGKTLVMEVVTDNKLKKDAAWWQKLGHEDAIGCQTQHGQECEIYGGPQLWVLEFHGEDSKCWAQGLIHK